ncbi:hypothetical protein [Seohaeicola zhoushanensis]|uniref:ABC transporter ATP-binding protein n=1 Tax=Seohaeicola zhoushanensis TaxID=1569283 RepID=A0A8J3H256_9RHOB|nr:hypothetical protein [Seohaeicola zhoushanensis]GHF67074.1 hypothetical protein GCM10017056_42890 [Seohaeicola zhoushanensis]
MIVEALAQDVQRICRDNDCTLILCEQNVWFSRACTDIVYVIDSGHIVFSGSWDDFDANPDVKQKHLGVS